MSDQLLHANVAFLNGLERRDGMAHARVFVEEPPRSEGPPIHATLHN